MGYRSNVYIKVYEPQYKELIGICKEHDFLPDMVFDCGEVKGKNTYSLVWEDIKWNPTYVGVNAIMDMIDEYEKDDIGFHYIEIGENYTDITDRCNDWDLELYIERKVDVDGYEIAIPD